MEVDNSIINDEMVRTRRNGLIQATFAGSMLIAACVVDIMSAFPNFNFLSPFMFPTCIIAYATGAMAYYNIGRATGYWNGLVVGRNETRRDNARGGR